MMLDSRRCRACCLRLLGRKQIKSRIN